MHLHRLIPAGALAALLALGCTGPGMAPEGAGGEASVDVPGAVGTVDIGGQLTSLAGGSCLRQAAPTAALGTLAQSTLLELRLADTVGGGQSALVALLNIEPPLMNQGTEPLPEAELLIPLLMREAELALRVGGVDVQFDQPSRNGYVSPDMRSGYLSATTAGGQRIAINFLCHELEAPSP